SGLALAEGLGRATRRLEPLVPWFVPTSDQLLEAEDTGGRFNPFTWHELYGRSSLGLRSVVVLVGVVLAALLASYWALGPRVRHPEVQMAYTLGLVFAGLFLATTLAAAAIASEKEDRTLEEFALVSHVQFPYVYGKFGGLLWTSLLLCVPPFVHTALFACLGDVTPLAPLAVLLALPLAMGFVIANGLYFSFRCRTVVRAVAASTSALLVLLSLQLSLGTVFPPVLLLNPAFVIPLVQWYTPRGSVLPVGATVLGWAVYVPVAFALNVRYIHGVLSGLANGFDRRLSEHLEGGGGDTAGR
ncbi:MAG: hypothetical protein HYZ53_02475, partial [Planctomycetes bacterium]|nr:hypothetical protein [Planctomycetota bacterium]